MAICNKCGATLPENGKFCTTCGAKVEDAQAAAPAANPAPAQAAPVQKEKKPVNKKLFIIIGAAVAALILVVAIIVVISSIVKTNNAIKEKTIKLNEEYFDVEFSGYEGYDVAISIEFTDDFEKDVAKAFGYSKKQASKDKAQKKIKDFKYAIDFEYEGLDEVSNGDEFKIKVSLVEDYDSKEKLEYVTDAAKKKDKKEADIIVKEIELTIEVEGLAEVVKYNPFDDLEVTEYGSDGDVWVDWSYYGDYSIGYYDFDCDNDYDLSIGDTYTITVDEDTVDYMLEYYGVLLTETSKTYKVESADRYITDMDDISDDIIDEMIELSIDEIEGDAYWTECTYGEYEYLGMYFMTLKEGKYGDENFALLVFKTTATPEDDDYDPFTIYVGCRCYDIFESADGEQSVNSWCYSYGVYTDIADDTWDEFYGFITERELYDYVIDDYEDTYDMTISEGLKDYANGAVDEEEEEEIVVEEYETIEDYLASEEAQEEISAEIENILEEQGDTYSAMAIYADGNTITYEYTFIDEQEAGVLDGVYTEDDFETYFEELAALVEDDEISFQLLFLNPDGTVVYDETFSNF